MADLIKEAGVVLRIRERLAPLSVYELRALYYLCRAADDAQGDDVTGLRIVRAVEVLIGKLPLDEALELYAVLMGELAERDPDLVARQMIQDAQSGGEFS